MQSVIKAFKVLEVFSLEQPELSFTEIVHATGLGRTNTHKLLKTLVSLNCLSQAHPGGLYRVGPKLFELGSLYLARVNLRRVAMPHLVRLAEEFGDTAYLCIEDSGEALCLERVDGPSPIKVTILQRGGRLPLHAGAAPLAILSAKSDAEIADLMCAKGFKRYTEKTVQDLSQLMKIVRKVRAQGFSESWEDVTAGVASLGASVLDGFGHVAGAISIGGLLCRYEEGRKGFLVQLIKDTAALISKELGYVPSPNHSVRRERR
jgi:IclR family KDG regulon transcriptional repressor